MKKSLFLLPFYMLTLLWAGAPHAGERATISTGNGVATEYWSGKVLSASFRAGMCFEAGGKARGVLILRHANGQEDTYHLYGTVKNNSFELSHGSGHHFQGRLSDGSMEGQVRLKGGMKLGLKGERKLDVPLLAEDCAPLQ